MEEGQGLRSSATEEERIQEIWRSNSVPMVTLSENRDVIPYENFRSAIREALALRTEGVEMTGADRGAIKDIKQQIEASKKRGDGDYEASWEYETGILLSRYQASLIVKLLNQAQKER